MHMLQRIENAVDSIENALEYLEKTDQKDSVGRKCVLLSEEWLFEIEKAIHEIKWGGRPVLRKKESIIHRLSYDTNLHI